MAYNCRLPDICKLRTQHLDCADLDRIGAGKELFDSAKKRVMIDHHISNPVFGDVNYVKGEIGVTLEYWNTPVS